VKGILLQSRSGPLCARGEEITTTHGLRAKLSRPLDFLVIADHAEMYGFMPQLLSGDQEILSTESGSD
jgi:hypothetical protein